MRFYSALIAVSALVACHHAAVELPEAAAPCFSPYPRPAGTIHIDGPGAFGPHAGDSLIVRVDNRERWHGIIRACVRAEPGLSMDYGSWQAAGDTLEPTAIDLVSQGRAPKIWQLHLVTRSKTKK